MEIRLQFQGYPAYAFDFDFGQFALEVGFDVI
jgi:hypothetical protein